MTLRQEEEEEEKGNEEEETLRWLERVEKGAEPQDGEEEGVLARLEGLLREPGRGAGQARALAVLCALVDRSARVRARVAHSAAWAALLVALASSAAAAPAPALRARTMDALCAWGARENGADDADGAYRALALVRDTAAAHGAVQTQTTPCRTSAAASSQQQQAAARPVLTAAQRARLRRGGVDVDALADAVAALRTAAARRTGPAVPALVAPLPRAQRSIARLLGTDDVLRDPALVTVLLSVNTDIVCASLPFSCAQHHTCLSRFSLSLSLFPL